jgi:hypothetical protein
VTASATDLREDRDVKRKVGQGHHGRAGQGAAGADMALVIDEAQPG